MSAQTESSVPLHAAAMPEAPSAAFFAGNPSVIGLPAFIAGSVALALVLLGYVPAGAVGASIPVIFAATGSGLLIAAVWAALLGQSAVASVFGIFSGFWLSYAMLVLGLLHNWFAISADAAVHTQGLFLITWLVIVVMLTLATLRLPLAFTVLFVLIDVALVVVLLATLNASSSLSKIAGIIVLAFAAVGVYLYYATVTAILGGGALPLGSPVIRS